VEIPLAEACVPYKVSIEQKAGYLHAVVTGTNSRESVVHYLLDILHECVTRNCFRVLIEERLDGPRLGTMDVFEIASGADHRIAERYPTIAYVDVNAAGDSAMKFAENVAVNRGFAVRVFPSAAGARRWLEDLDRERAAPKP
jgi:predicted lysophospholipase L1 biosynthesis ABC-type transport system permease subunit